MKSNYKSLGDYIRPVNIRNTELKVDNLMGININKFFMPSVANTIGTDMSKYKIVKNGQFACNRMHVGRDKRLPVSLWNGENDIIVSPAYDVFEITDTEILNSDYLMMWFLRKEFDRNAWFYTDADVRGGLKWGDFCKIRLPIPDINRQKEFVKEYTTLVNRIYINNILIQKLEETTQTIYRQWFVDFEFPDINGKPYKSNDGEMEFNEVLDRDIPKGWEYKTLNEIMSIKHGFAFKGEYFIEDENENILLTPGNFKIGGGFKADNFKYYNGAIPEDYVLESGDLIVTMTDLSVGADTIGYPAIVPEIKNKRLLHNQRLGKITSNNNLKYYIYWLMRSSDYRFHILGGITGTTVKHTSPSKILDYKFPFCKDQLLIERFVELAEKIQKMVEQMTIESNNLTNLKDLLLSKLATRAGSL